MTDSGTGKKLQIPQGFKTSSVLCGIRKKTTKDAALIVSETDCVCAAKFTTNKFRAAPVQLDIRYLAETNNMARAIFVNSANANACTGERGMRDAETLSQAISAKLIVDHRHVLVSSTGVIGVFLPMDRMLEKIEFLTENLCPDSEAWEETAEAILTTDTVRKLSSCRREIGGKSVTMLGMIKGAGMIAPNLATMLSFIVTDAKVESAALSAALDGVADETFNCISVDGDTSTNDTVFVMANGVADNTEICVGTPQFEAFRKMLCEVCKDLVTQLVRDGEGATKLIEIEVRGAKTLCDAQKCARAIANSSLVKTAVFGCDPNWGRIVCAAGYSGADFDPEKVELCVNSFVLFEEGMPVDFDESEVSDSLANENVHIVLDLHDGNETITFWTCDLSHDYVEINSAYRS